MKMKIRTDKSAEPLAGRRTSKPDVESAHQVTPVSAQMVSPQAALNRALSLPLSKFSPGDILALQRAIGNRAVLRIAARQQEKEAPKSGWSDDVRASMESPENSFATSANRDVIQRLKYEGVEQDLTRFDREQSRKFYTMILENEIAIHDQTEPPYDLEYTEEEKKALEFRSKKFVFDLNNSIVYTSSYQEFAEATEASLGHDGELKVIAPMAVEVKLKAVSDRQPAPKVMVAPIQNVISSKVTALYEDKKDPTMWLEKQWVIDNPTLDAEENSIFTDPPQSLNVRAAEEHRLIFRDNPNISIPVFLQRTGQKSYSLKSVDGITRFVVWIAAINSNDNSFTYVEQFGWNVQWTIIVEESIENHSEIQLEGTTHTPQAPITTPPLANDAYGSDKGTEREILK
jgi:hypothetical protein